MAATIIRCCPSFSQTSGGLPPPREKSRGPGAKKQTSLVDVFAFLKVVQARVLPYFVVGSFQGNGQVLGSFSGHLTICSGISPLLFSDIGKFATSIGYSVVRKPGDYHPVSKIKLLSAHPSVQTPFVNNVSDFEGIGRLKLPVMAVLLTNSLLLGTPLEALAAEICEPESSMFGMPVLSLVALVGATVGGLLARQRRGELQRLNEQLRQINAALRRQAKIESYAPGLSYAPAGARIPESKIIVEPKKQELISKLKTGKTFLRNQEPEKAFAEFKIALELAQNLRDPIEEKKAARGLGASLQRQGKYREAIQYHSMVLAISKREGEDSGITEAYGAIADCYTELGDLEKAGNFYDTYIARLVTD